MKPYSLLMDTAIARVSAGRVVRTGVLWRRRVSDGEDDSRGGGAEPGGGGGGASGTSADGELGPSNAPSSSSSSSSSPPWQKRLFVLMAGGQLLMVSKATLRPFSDRHHCLLLLYHDGMEDDNINDAAASREHDRHAKGTVNVGRHEDHEFSFRVSAAPLALAAQRRETEMKKLARSNSMWHDRGNMLGSSPSSNSIVSPLAGRRKAGTDAAPAVLSSPGAVRLADNASPVPSSSSSSSSLTASGTFQSGLGGFARSREPPSAWIMAASSAQERADWVAAIRKVLERGAKQPAVVSSQQQAVVAVPASSAPRPIVMGPPTTTMGVPRVRGRISSRSFADISRVMRESGKEIDPEQLTVTNEVVGKGASGVVLRGLWLGSTPVAVKSINNLPEFVEPAELRDFFKEMELLSGLRHPNIVQMYGFSLKGERVCLVQELVSGGDLRGLYRRPATTQALKSQLALSTARGMIFIHSKSIIHRDLKPHNLLVESWDTGQVKVCDFGLSISGISIDEEVTATIAGTPAYAAPELSSPQHDKSVDTFSFGMVLWEMATCRQVWPDKPFVWEIREAITHGERPVVPADSPWGALMARCWAQNPSKRPSFDEIYAELQTAAATASTTTTANSVPATSSQLLGGRAPPPAVFRPDDTAALSAIGLDALSSRLAVESRQSPAPAPAPVGLRLRRTHHEMLPDPQELANMSPPPPRGAFPTQPVPVPLPVRPPPPAVRVDAAPFPVVTNYAPIPSAASSSSSSSSSSASLSPLAIAASAASRRLRQLNNVLDPSRFDKVNFVKAEIGILRHMESSGVVDALVPQAREITQKIPALTKKFMAALELLPEPYSDEEFLECTKQMKGVLTTLALSCDHVVAVNSKPDDYEALREDDTAKVHYASFEDFIAPANH